VQYKQALVSSQGKLIRWTRNPQDQTQEEADKMTS